MNNLNIFNQLVLKNPTPSKKSSLKDFLWDNIYHFPGWIFQSEQEVVEIKYKKLKQTCIKCGFTDQILYDILILGLTDINDRPKCPICGKPVKFVHFIQGYRTTCGNPICTRESIKKSVTKLWQNPDYSQIQSLAHVEWAKTEEHKQQMRDNTLKIWQRDGYREHQKEVHIKWAETDEHKQQMRENSLKMWQKEGYREHQSHSHAQWALNNPGKIVTGISGKLIATKSSRKDSEIGYDSNWEKLFIEFCQETDEIISIDRASVIISYEYDGGLRSYLPDFVVKTSTKCYLIEIKPNWRIQKDEKTRKKIEAGYKYVNLSNEFDEYLVFTEDHLFINSSNTKNIINTDYLKQLLK